jgi:hypothetical protein
MPRRTLVRKIAVLGIETRRARNTTVVEPHDD